MKPKFERFLSPKELKEKTTEWQHASKTKDPLFSKDRLEKDEASAITWIHGLSFIKDKIPALIVEAKKRGEKVKILEIGAGAALYTDQIREMFPDDVEVFSTGLKKKIAKEFRKNNSEAGEAPLHPNDLKWRSVLELSDFEEFDLIIDTHGEFRHSLWEEDASASIELHTKAVKYVTAVIRKLKPGGFASLVAPPAVSLTEGVWPKITSDLEREYNVKITIPKARANLLRIEKPKKE